MAQAQSTMQAAITENKTWFYILGVLLILLGIAAVAFPLVTTIAAKIFLGWLFLIGGVIQIVHAFSTRAWSEFFLDLLVLPADRYCHAHRAAGPDVHLPGRDRSRHSVSHTSTRRVDMDVAGRHRGRGCRRASPRRAAELRRLGHRLARWNQSDHVRCRLPGPANGGGCKGVTGRVL